MNIGQLMQTSEQYRLKILDAIKEYVLDNGDEMNEHYQDEFGIWESECSNVVKVLDISNPGCYFTAQQKVNDDDLDKLDLFSSNNEQRWKDYGILSTSFTHHAIWALYVLKDNKTGEENLCFYEFYNGGLKYDEKEAEPCHALASDLNLDELNCILVALFLREEKLCRTNQKK